MFLVLTCVDKKNRRRFSEVGDRGFFVAPLSNGFGLDKLVVATRYAGGYAEFCRWAAHRDDVVYHLVVAVGRFDENLRLVVGVGGCFEISERSLAFVAANRQVAMECKLLSVKSACH